MKKVLVVLALLAGVNAASAQEKISKPGVYRGYSQPLYDGWQRNGQYVTARDGTKLAVDLYRPTNKGQLVTTPLPVIWQFTPYRRALYDESGKVISRQATTLLELTKYGYVIAVADVRGKGASFGFRKSMHGRQEAEDSFDLTEWFAAQPWSTGKIGMWGGSYNGGTVAGAVTTMPPHLKAVFFGITDFNMYDGWVRGGIMRYSQGADNPVSDDLLTVPVDEDKDKSMLKAAVAQHHQNALMNPMMIALPFRDSWTDVSDSYFWSEVNYSGYLAQIKKSGVAAYMYGGWHDFLRRDTVLSYVNWPNAKKMLIGPWAHGPGANSTFDFATEHLRWFDYHLKGVENGILNEPPIYHAVNNAAAEQAWRFANDWPLAEAKSANWFLQRETLSASAPTELEAKDEYKIVYGIKADVEPLREAPVTKGASEWDQKGLTWTSAPLNQAVTVIGHPLAQLWLACSSDDADVFVVLEDVDEAGNSQIVADGRLRLSLRATHQAPYNFLSLPWRRFYKTDEHKLTPGQPVKVTIDLMPTATIFKPGHRIRLALTGSQGRTNYQQQAVPPTLTVLRDALRSSYLSLPSIGEQR
jgi:putative CocE/NonD family hydrolase